MMKKSRVIAGAPLLALALAGCGGDDSGTSTSSSYAYYVDSAVSGITYQCGTQSGTTDTDGKFYFDSGSSCTFSLSYTDDDGATQSVTLKTLSAETTQNLQTGESYQETDSTVATVLQSLDSDSDDDTITISEDTIAAVLTTLADDDYEVTDVDSLADNLAKDESNVESAASISVVSETTATSHVLKNILVNNPGLLDVGYDEGAIYATLSFAESSTDDDQLTVSAYTDQFGEETLSSGTYSIADHTLKLSTTEDGETYSDTYTLSLVTTDDGYYIQVTDTDDSDADTTAIAERLYLSSDKDAAESYLVQNILTNNTTMYLAESGMTTAETWTYAADTASFDDTQPVLTVTNDDDTVAITFTGFDEDYLSYTYTETAGTETSSGSGRMYYDKSTANTYLASLTDDDDDDDADNSGTSDSDSTVFTSDMVSGKTFYTSDFEELAFSDINTSTITATELLNTEDNETDSYTINSDGQLELGSGDDIATITLESIGTDYYYVKSENDEDGTEYFYLYTSQSALESALVDDALPTSVTDDSDDSANTTHAGFELTGLTAEEINGDQIQVTVTANGSISDALAQSTVINPDTGEADTSGNYTNMLWVDFNDTLGFGMSADGSWCQVTNWADGESQGTTSLDDSSYSSSLSADGKTLTITIDEDQIPTNDSDYLVVQAEMGANYEDGDNSDGKDYTYDEVLLATDWTYDDDDDDTDNYLVGAWVKSDTNAPFATMAVILDDDNYIGAQQVLGEDGVLGGIEAGTYTSTLTDTESEFSDAVPVINSNKGDTLTDAELTVTAADPDALTLTADDDSATLTKIEATDDHPEAGAWYDFDNKDILLVFDGNGHYMEVDMNYDASSFSAEDGEDDVLENATEYGTYVIDGTTMTMTPDDDTSVSVTCSEDDDTNCGTIAGDSNLSAGFDDAATIEDVAITDDTLSFQLTEDNGDVYNIDLERVQ